MKACSKCGEVKGLGEFYKKSAATDGRGSACKLCTNKTTSDWRNANKNRVASTGKAWHEENKCRHSASSRAWKEENKEKIIEYREANKERQAELTREWYRKNKDRKAETGKAWRDANKERQAATQKAWRESNKERQAETHKAWRESNRDKTAAYCRNRRASIRNSEGTHTAADILAIFTNQHGLCATCQIKLAKSGKNKYHVDHIMPLALGGSNWPANLQCLCQSCNLRKSAKHPDDWAKQNGRLL